MDESDRQEWQAYYDAATKMCEGCPEPCDSLKPWICTRPERWKSQELYDEYWAARLPGGAH